MSNVTSFRQIIRDIGVSLIPPIFVYYGLYAIPEHFGLLWESADIPAHFAGGVSIAWMGWILWRKWTAYKWLPATIPWPLRDSWLLGLTAMISVAWEWYEWLHDHYLGTNFQPSLADTMGDFVMDALGGIFFLIILHLLIKRRSQK